MFIPQELVRDFHRALKHPAPEEPTLEHFRPKLRANLIVEEAIEFANAAGFQVEIDAASEHGFRLLEVGRPDWPKMIDALCDLAYVTFGAAVEMGIDLLPFFYVVHRANMRKAGGEQRADGKTLKPEGFKPPDEEIRELLREMLANFRKEPQQ